MTHRIISPATFGRFYNVGLVAAATVGLIMAFLLVLQHYDAARTLPGPALAVHVH